MTDDIVTRLREAAQVDEYYAVTMHRPLLIAVADAIERLRAEKSEMLAVGNSLLRFAVADNKCQCRREWICHRCKVIDEWKSLCDD